MITNNSRAYAVLFKRSVGDCLCHCHVFIEEKVMRRVLWMSLLCGVLLSVLRIANAGVIDGASIAAGFGKPQHLRGTRIAVQKQWHVNWLPMAGWHTTGYWDASLAYWRTHGDDQGRYKTITIFGAAPIFRIERAHAYSNTLQPYVEGGIGLAILSKNRLAQRRLGAHWEFQDLIGCGLRFGTHQEYDLSYHYLHYSNAGFSKYNSGIDVKSLVMFSYHFA